MAEKEFELDDPFQPVAVRLATPGYDGVEAMARCFVEEFALLGWPPERIFKLFTAPQFAGSYSVFQERGEAYWPFGPAVSVVCYSFTRQVRKRDW